MEENKPNENRFSTLLTELLHGLDWTQKTLCEKTGLDESRLSEYKSGFRRISQSDLIKIGTALFDGAEVRKTNKGQHIDRKFRIARYPTLTSLLNDLLRAEGYGSLDTGLTNAIWNELHPIPPTKTKTKEEKQPTIERRGFRIGWTPLAHYCPKKGEGIQFDIGDAVSKLLNLKVEWCFYPYKEDVFTILMDDVRDGKIDAVGPFMFHIPSRNSRVRFTDSIGFYERFVVMAGSKDISAIVEQYPDGPRRHVLCYVEEDASEVMGKFLFYSARDEAYKNESEIISKMIKDPTDENDNVRCFVTGAIDFDRLNEDPEANSLFHANLEFKLSDNSSFQFHLPTGFAVAEDEPRLAEQINNCLRILKKNGYIYKYLRHKYGAQLAQKVVWEDKLKDWSRWNDASNSLPEDS
jgi:transcriptional regulator with XRE-family HTH domain